MGVTIDEVRRMALALPAVVEGTSYGTPAFIVRQKRFVRVKEDGETLVLRVNLFERDLLLEREPEVFHITDHYRDYPAVLLRLAAVTPERLQTALEDAWRFCAPRKLVTEYDARTG
ncbi:MAG TPA: MmcQ/YjbR family DNA-binding protein [Longimicrobium sp.]|nr:MmcQ/YjbR family DNA-binding protein [Longimicrobium sp.]